MAGIIIKSYLSFLENGLSPNTDEDGGFFIVGELTMLTSKLTWGLSPKKLIEMRSILDSMSAFCNTMTLEETEAVYKKFVVQDSRNVIRTSIKKDGKIDFNKPHAPLLFIAGEKDHLIPSSLNYKNYKSYKDKNSRTDFKEFPGRTHFICGQPNWEEVAEYISKWIK